MEREVEASIRYNIIMDLFRELLGCSRVRSRSLLKLSLKDKFLLRDLT